VRASIQDHFAFQHYSVADIIEWVKWFCSTHGSPVFYETPVPQDGAWMTSDPGYKVSLLNPLVLFCSYFIFKKPRGFLKNKLLVNVVANFLPEIKGTAFDFGPPRGLFVLILTAVSYAFNHCWLFEY
jgi:hypothetical protein